MTEIKVQDKSIYFLNDVRDNFCQLPMEDELGCIHCSNAAISRLSLLDSGLRGQTGGVLPRLKKPS